MNSYNLLKLWSVLSGFALILANDSYAETKLKFGIPTNLGSVINSTANDASICFSPDGLELYFGSDRSSGQGNFDIWLTTRPTPTDAWGWPVNLGPPINTSAVDSAPCLSADGLELYFASDRPGGSGSIDLWVTTRTTLQSSWSTPANLGTTVNTWADECFPVMSSDGLELYFSEYTVPHPSGYGGGDIWVVKRASVQEPWGIAENLGPTVNTSLPEMASQISADGLHLYFNSSGHPGYGVEDTWVTTRISHSDPWGEPVNLGPSVNSTAWDAGPVFSPDGSKLYFSSNRYGSYGNGSYDIWQVSVSVVSTSDVDENGVVDMRDFAAFAEDWLWEE